VRQPRRKLEQELGRLQSLTAEQIAVELIGLVEPRGLDPMPFQSARSRSAWCRETVGCEARKSSNSGCSLTKEHRRWCAPACFTSRGWGGTGDGNVYGLSRAGREALAEGSAEQVIDGRAGAG
jgi:hypothetical protein